MRQIENGEVAVVLRQDVKKGGEFMATYRMDYPDLASALQAVADDIRAGRVEEMIVGGQELSRQEISALLR